MCGPCYQGLDGTEGIGTCMAGLIPCEGGTSVCNDERPKVQDCMQDDPNCDGILGCTGHFRWAHGNLPAHSTAVAAGHDGTVALLGISTGAVGFFLQTYDARGRLCWSSPTIFSGGGTLDAVALAFSGAKQAGGRLTQLQCAGDGTSTPLGAHTLVVGQAQGTFNFGKGSLMSAGIDAFVASVDPTGKVEWGYLFGSDMSDIATAVAVGKNGEYYVVGNAGNALSTLPCPGMLDAGLLTTGGAFVARIEQDGTCGWLEMFTGQATATGVAVDGAGNVVVSGTMSGPVTFAPGVNSMGAPGSVFFVKLDPTGALVGGPVPGGCEDNAPLFIAAAPSGDVFGLCTLPGTSSCPANGETVALAHLDPSFMTQPYTCISAMTGGVRAEGLAVDEAGSVVVLLSSDGPVTGDMFHAPIDAGNLVIAKLTSSYKDYVWGVAYGAGSTLSGYGLAVDGMGDVAVGVLPTAPLGLGPVTLPGGMAAGVFELAP
jgi:hypothetical protein